LQSAWRYVAASAESYLREWERVDTLTLQRFTRALKGIAAHVNANDIACFVKPGSLCPFCNMATALLEAADTQLGFSYHSADLLHDEREALRLHLNSQGHALPGGILRYPVIFVRGSWLRGGYEELKGLYDSGSLDAALGAAPQPMLVTALQLPSESKPRLLQAAGGGSWLAYHVYIFSNVLRLIALQQVLVLAVCLSVGGVVADVLLSAIGIDCLLFVCLGPAPFSLTGVVATLLCWERRGAVVAATPYKFTLSLYAAGAAANLICRYAQGACGLPHGTGLMTTLLINSSLLAVLRF